MRRKLMISLLMCICISLFIGCAKIDEPEETPTPADTPKNLFLDAEIQEQTVYDGQEMVITAVSLEMNAPEGPVLKFSGENKTDKGYVITIRNCSVNNIMIEPKFEMKMGSKGAVTADAVFSGRFLLIADIRTFSGISFCLRIADAFDSQNYIETDQYNMLTSMTGKYTQKYDFPGALIADSNGIKIKIGRVADSKALMGKQIYIYIENPTSTDIFVETKETLVDGIEIDPMFFAFVGAGKKSWAPLTFQHSDIIKNGLESIDDLVVSLRAISIYGTIVDTGACRIVFEQKSGNDKRG